MCVGAQEFEIVQEFGNELRAAAARSGTQMGHGRPLTTLGNGLPIVPTLLSAARRLVMVTTAGVGSDPFRRAAALGMVAAAVRHEEFTAQMRGNRIALQ